MKKGLILGIMLLFAAVVNAQQQVVLKMKDGSTVQRLVKNVESITFKEVDPLAVTSDVSNVTYNGAKVNVTVSGYFDADTEVSLIYSTSQDEVLAGNGTKLTSSVSNDNGNIYWLLSDLEPLTTYYYVVCAENKGYQEVKTDVISFTTLEKVVEPQYVDLGLSVKWATCNIGAETDTEYGGCYVWGDATGTLGLNDDLSFIYNVPSKPDDVNKSNTIAGTQHDIATQKLGKGWRMPTVKEINELNNLASEWVENYKGTGARGFVYTSPTTKNSIFLPAAGWETSAADGIEYRGSRLYYWTAEKEAVNQGNVRYAYINNGVVRILSKGYSSAMMAIRPVYFEEPVEDHEGETAEAGKSVDLGLSVKWGDRNVGATTVNEVGSYFAWGETETKTSFLQSTYKWTKETIEDITDPYVDLGSTISGTENDAATKRWGGQWRMPTRAEMTELLENCTKTWKMKDGVYGYEFSREGYEGTIFFPAAGYKAGETVYGMDGDKSCGYYWTATQHSQRKEWAIDIEVTKDPDTAAATSRNDRANGLLIRPVRSK